MIRKMLVPVDTNLSPGSSTLNYALKLASKLQADLSTIRIIRCESAIEELAETGSKPVDNGGIPIQDMLKELAAYVEGNHIDLTTIIDEALPEINWKKLSDTGMKLLRQTKIPVLLIRINQLKVQNSKLIKKILVPLDGTEDASPIVEHVAEMASAFQAQVVLLHVIALEGREPVVASSTFLAYESKIMEDKRVLSSHYLDNIAEQIKQKNAEIKVVCETRVGSAAAEIVDCANDLEADLMAMSTRGHTGLRRWVFGSTATEVIRHFNKNLLLVSQ